MIDYMRRNSAAFGQSRHNQLIGATMKPHHKPKNVALSKISRLRVSFKNRPPFVRDTAADLSVSGQHLGFEVSQAALMRIRGGFI